MAKFIIDFANVPQCIGMGTGCSLGLRWAPRLCAHDYNEGLRRWNKELTEHQSLHRVLVGSGPGGHGGDFATTSYVDVRVGVQQGEEGDRHGYGIYDDGQDAGHVRRAGEGGPVHVGILALHPIPMAAIGGLTGGEMLAARLKLEYVKVMLFAKADLPKGPLPPN